MGTLVEVRYLYAFRESGSIYQPFYLGERDDIPAEECTVDQLKYKANWSTPPRIHVRGGNGFFSSDYFDQPVRRSLLTAIALRAPAVGEGVSPAWQPEEIPLGDGRILILDDS